MPSALQPCSSSPMSVRDGIGREGRLAGPGKAEEESRVLPVLPVVGAAVHRQHPLLRQVVVHDAEDALLDLARVDRAADQDHPAGEVEEDEGGALRAVLRRVGLEGADVDHREARLENLELLAVGLVEEHVLGKEVVPRLLGDDPDRQPVVGVRSRVAVEDEEVLVRHVGLGLGEEPVEALGVEGPVDVAPPDLPVRRGIPDRELVVGRAAGVLAGGGDQGALAGDPGLAAPDRLLVELGGREIPVDHTSVAEPLLVDAVRAHKGAIVLHADHLGS